MPNQSNPCCWTLLLPCPWAPVCPTHRDVNLYQMRDDLRLKQVTIPGPDAVQIGTAWATCYLTSGIDYCGEGALCDNMVLTFKGGVYETLVRSTLPESMLGDNTCFNENSFMPYEDVSGNRRLADNSTNTNTTGGLAIMMSGPVTLTSMDKPLPWAQGYMDYVPVFFPDARRLAGRKGRAAGKREAPPTSTMQPILVTPNTYRIKLAARKGKDMYESAAQ